MEHNPLDTVSIQRKLAGSHACDCSSYKDEKKKKCHHRIFTKYFTSDSHYWRVLETKTQLENLAKLSLELKYFILLKVYSTYKTKELLIWKNSSNYKIVLAIQCIQRLNLA